MTRILFSGIFVAAIVGIGCEAPEEMQVERIQQGLVAKDPFHNGAGVEIYLGRLYYPQYSRYMTALLYKSKSTTECVRITLSDDLGLKEGLEIYGTPQDDGIFLLAPFQETYVDCPRDFGRVHFGGAPSWNNGDFKVYVDADNGNDVIQCDGEANERLECLGAAGNDMLITGHNSNSTHLGGWTGDDKFFVNASGSWISVSGFDGNDCVQAPSWVPPDRFSHIEMNWQSSAGWDKCTQSGPNWVGCEQIVSSCL